VRLRGTVRSHDAAIRDLAERRLAEIAGHTAARTRRGAAAGGVRWGGSRPAAVALSRDAARWAAPRPAMAPPTHPPSPGAAAPRLDRPPAGG
jgi:hypothetical protein